MGSCDDRTGEPQQGRSQLSQRCWLPNTTTVRYPKRLHHRPNMARKQHDRSHEHNARHWCLPLRKFLHHQPHHRKGPRLEDLLLGTCSLFWRRWSRGSARKVVTFNLSTHSVTRRLHAYMKDKSRGPWTILLSMSALLEFGIDVLSGRYPAVATTWLTGGRLFRLRCILGQSGGLWRTMIQLILLGTYSS